MSDKINPSHYQFDGIQVIDLTKHLPCCEGNVVKYCARAGKKANESKLDDLLKAKHYLDVAIDLAIQERARQEALRHGLTRCDSGACPEPDNCTGCVSGPAEGSQLQVCEYAGKPVGDCNTCIHRVNCKIRKKDQNELDGDDQIAYHTSVPEAITRAGRTRKVL
jgi:hypothetical protein